MLPCCRRSWRFVVGNAPARRTVLVHQSICYTYGGGPGERNSVRLDSPYWTGHLNVTDPTENRLLEVLDKGKAASVTTLVHTRNKNTGELLFENQATVFIRGAGGFGGKRTGAGTFLFFSAELGYTVPHSNVIVDRGAATAANVPPKRTSDAVMEERTSHIQAALYRSVLLPFINPSLAVSHPSPTPPVKQTERGLQSITRTCQTLPLLVGAGLNISPPIFSILSDHVWHASYDDRVRIGRFAPDLARLCRDRWVRQTDSARSVKLFHSITFSPR